MNRTRSLIAAGTVVIGLAAGACSSDSQTSTSGATTPSTTAMTPTTTMTETTAMTSGTAEAMSDIVDTAAAAGDFETLLTAVQAAGLEDTLRGEGPFTVFAPTDEAFAALPAGTLEALLADPTGDLASILTYHVVEGAVPASAVVELDGQTVETVNGATITVAVGADGTVSLTDATGNTVEVITTDIQTSNGVIHVIDGVLLPTAP